ncbi:acetyltransferase/esterase, partial [Melanomma pulvis-pyrius CBS 109.77]
LPVPGASLYYETYGTGPLLLFISGGNGNADIWRPIASVLQANFTVAIYDRRGYSRSYLSATQPQDYANRLAVDVEDARLLIDHLSKGPATVLGTSSGAIVALELLLRHPTHLRTLIPHEPPAIMILPDKDNLTAVQHNIYDTYRKSGIPPAMIKFAAAYKALDTLGPFLSSMDAKNGPFVNGNTLIWLERELLPYPLHDFNLTAMGQHKELLLLANGEGSDPTALQRRANDKLAETFGLEVVLFPGAHTGYQTDPLAFATTLVTALVKK